jgi:hypothetical protein
MVMIRYFLACCFYWCKPAPRCLSLGAWNLAHGACAAVHGAWLAPREPWREVLYLLGVVMYLFFIETASGERVEWRGLSRQMAVRMYTATGRCAVAKSWGWEEEREPLSIRLDTICNSGV